MDLQGALINVALLWLLTTPHEFAHAWVATKLGDDTPLREGRVTLNPLAHVDWIGTVLLPAVTSLAGAGFLGWGKPVNTNPSKLRYGLNGLALVALAGPASNVVFAVVLAAVAAATAHANLAVANFAAQGVRLSLYLALFNMIPVPPLDGSKLLLAARVPVQVYTALARYGFLLLIVLMAYTEVGITLSAWSVQTARAMLGWFR
ncbi:MAG: peptidase [Bryobacterales bacterium]|jgi:Zn-dependent protease|nr:peptidase [Bryobacterales bacterium]